MSSADNFCKQFGPRSSMTRCWAWSGSKLFDTLMVFLKEFFEKVHSENSQQTTIKSFCLFQVWAYSITRWALSPTPPTKATTPCSQSTPHPTALCRDPCTRPIPEILATLTIISVLDTPVVYTHHKHRHIMAIDHILQPVVNRVNLIILTVV